MREDYARYLDDARLLDQKVAATLELLEKSGMAENTVVLFFGDNGEAMARGKQFCYEEGLRVPMILRWPKGVPAPDGITPGRVESRFIEAIDFAPTMLALAGAPVPDKMQGRVFLGEKAAPAREHVFGARDRCDETVFRFRTVRDARFRYIRNFTPDRPFLQANGYKEKAYPAWNLLKELHAAGKLTPEQEFLCAPTMPAEELYDLETDPHEVKNLAADPAHAETLKRLRAVLEKWIAETDDQGAKAESDEMIKNKGLKRAEAQNPNKGYTVDGGPPR